MSRGLRHRSGRRAARERGVALVLALVVIGLVMAVVATLVPLATAERLLARTSREAAECHYAAEAIVAYAIGELQARSSWDSALTGTGPSMFADTTRTLALSGSEALDLDDLGATLPSVEPGSWGADTPRWRLFAWGPARRLAPGVIASPVYVAVWTADDERDGDGQPDRDANGRLRLRGEAFGPLGGRVAVIATLVRELPAPAALRLADWRVP